MLQLQPQNLLIQKTILESLDALANGQPQILDRIITDFDYTTYHVSTYSEDRTQLLVSLTTRAWPDLLPHRVDEHLSSIFSKQWCQVAQAESGYDFSIVVDLTQLQALSDEAREEAVNDLSLYKCHALSAPFNTAFSQYYDLASKFEASQVEPSSSEVYVINYREDERIYVKPSFDRITVIFQTIFKDETDKVFGKIFLQEFVDARKRSIQNAPQVLYSNEPPLEISHLGASATEDQSFITFVLFPRHLTQQKKFNTISRLQVFRSYFHYHIKCSKAYMHSRMRKRVDGFNKVLNRAKLENENKERKTISGKRMVV